MPGRARTRSATNKRPTTTTSVHRKKKTISESSDSSSHSIATTISLNINERPHRKIKVAKHADPTVDDEEAQLKLAIQLSLKEQRKDKRPRMRRNKMAPAKVEKHSKVAVAVHSKKTVSTPKKRVAQQEISKTKDVSPEIAKSPTKKLNKEKGGRVKRKLEEQSDDDEVSLKKLKRGYKKQTEATALSDSPSKNIPSTTSFISYVLQKGAKNRDMNLVKMFEKTEKSEEISCPSSLQIC